MRKHRPFQKALKAQQDRVRARSAKTLAAQPSIMVDGISYKIPTFLRDATDEEIIRTIRGWKKG